MRKIKSIKLTRNNMEEEFHKVSETKTELEELKLYDLELRNNAADFIRKENGLPKENGNVHAFKTIDGLGDDWFIFVDVQNEERYRIHVIIFEKDDSGTERIRWWDSHSLKAENDAWKDVSKYLEGRYPVIVRSNGFVKEERR